MTDVLRTIGRAFAQHWPVLLAWYLGGELAHVGLIQIAGFVGGHNAIAGFVFLLPLAALAKLISFVAMFLVLRDSLRELQAIAPLPDDAAERRVAFQSALLSSVLPFLAFYAAWGFQKEDALAQSGIAWSVYQDEFWAAGLDSTVTAEGRVNDLSDYPTMITIMVVAFVLRWLWNRYRDKLPKPTLWGALYIEAIWIYLAVSIVADVLGVVTGWVDTRVGMVWLDGITTWFAEYLSPVAFVWDGVVWLVGEVAGLTLLPLAWLTIAGVIYGQAVSAQAPALHHRRVAAVRQRYERVDSRIRARVSDLLAPVTGRFTPIWDAFVLMFRAGPLLVGGYVLLYAGWTWAEGWLLVAVSRVFGPQELTVWLTLGDVPVWFVGFVMEPLRIVMVAAVYDRTIGRLPREAKEAAASDADAMAAAGEAAAIAETAEDATGAPGAGPGPRAVAEAVTDLTAGTDTATPVVTLAPDDDASGSVR